MARFGSTRPVRREEYHSQHQDPSEGHPEGVPEFPAALPGLHHYGTKQAVPVEHDLDVGPADPYYGTGGMAHGVPAQHHHGGRPTARPEDRAEHGTRQLVEEELRTRPDPIPVYLVDMGGGSGPLKRAALRAVPVSAAGADPQVLVPRNPHRSSVRVLNESGDSPVTATGSFAAAGNGTATLPLGAAITGFDVTIAAPAAANTIVVTVTGAQGGTLTYQLPSTASAIEPLSIRFPAELQPATPATAIAVTATGAAGTPAGNIAVYGAAAGAPVRLLFDLALSGGALLPAGMSSYLQIDTEDEICVYCPAGGPAQISVIEQYDVPSGG